MARTQAGLNSENEKFRQLISRLVMFKRKQVTPERLVGRQLLRSLGLTSDVEGSKVGFCEYNGQKSCKRCPDCILYGFGISDKGSERSKVYSDSGFSLSSYETSHRSFTFNAPSEDTLSVCRQWRGIGSTFASSTDAPDGLYKYAVAWAGRADNPNWQTSVPVLELVYGLLHYFPSLYDDPEGQVYLEVFTRQVSACQQVGDFSARVLTNPENPGASEASVRELLRNFLAPIASGTVKINEELMDAFPRDRLSILSIHQSKGLEFPLTIVYVGAEFSGNYAAQKFKRFPDKGGTPHVMEDLLRPHTALKAPGW